MSKPELPTSKLTSKYQATIPASIREQLELDKGDTIAFYVEGDKVILRKAPPLDLTYLRGLETTLGEWSSAYDDEAYGEL